MSSTSFRVALFAVAVTAAPLGLARAQAPRLEAFPARVTLDSAQDRHRVVVLETDADGITREPGAALQARVSPPDVAELVDGVLRPLRDGEAELVVETADRTARVAITVRDAATAATASFRNDVIPVLTRAGCNAGACHGAASGKNGFGLSLFGFDPARDHLALSRDARGRRIDCADPESSLVLAKPSGELRHAGGRRLSVDDASWRTLRAWIADGAPDDGERAPALRALRVEPREFVLAGAGQRARFVVTAEYADGELRDVTDLALLSSSNPTSATLEGDVIVSGSRGEAVILARFGHLAEVAQVIAHDAAAPPPASDAGAPPWVELNELDRFVHARLRKLRIAPAPLCDDGTFVRRIHLDLAGRLPTVEETRAFLADGSADKRSRLVDALLAGPEFALVMANAWAELLRIESNQLESKGAHVWTAWLRDAFQRGEPFDRIVRAMLTARGSAFTNPPANFWVVSQDPKVIAEGAAQTFLGVRLQCAQCHNHPFERWTMDDYYGFAAFFGQVGRKRGDDPRDTIVFDAGRGEVQNARNGRTSRPRPLGGEELQLAPGVDRRVALAEWLVAPGNTAFAENVANRVFARLMGRGLVEPVDDVRVSNPPSNAALHRWLGEQLVASGFDLRAIARLLCNSATYQSAAAPAQIPASSFAGAVSRRLAAEPLLDAIAAVTGVPSKFRGLPLGASAAKLVDADAGNRFLALFGRPRRESVCACERREEPTLDQVLHLINGETIEAKLAAKEGRLARLLAAGASPEAILDELFVAAYARSPRDDERARLLGAIAAAGDPAAAWEDVLWAILNSKEFLFRH